MAPRSPAGDHGERPQVPAEAEGEVSFCVGDPVIPTGRGPLAPWSREPSGVRKPRPEAFGLRSFVGRAL